MQISSLKSYESSVIEGIVAWREAFRGLEFADVERVVLLLEGEATLGLLKRGAEKGIAVAGQHNLPRLEVEGDDRYFGLGDGEAVDDGIGDVLVLHLLQHLRDDGGTGGVIGEDFVRRLTVGEQLVHVFSAVLGKGLFVRLGILIEFATHKALAVAHEPYLTAQTAEDDG